MYALPRQSCVHGSLMTKSSVMRGSFTLSTVLKAMRGLRFLGKSDQRFDLLSVQGTQKLDRRMCLSVLTVMILQ